MDFGEQKTHVKKHGVTAPFTKDSPFLDLLGLGPVEKFDRSKVPKEIWLDSPEVGAESVAARDAQAYEKVSETRWTLSALWEIAEVSAGVPSTQERGWLREDEWLR